MYWRIRNGAALVWQTWDDEEFLLYDASTGDTHLVNRVTREALRLLEASPHRGSDLSHHIADELHIEHGIEFESSIADLLAHLDRIGLAEPVG